MGQYLDKFAGTVRQRQAEQILKLLNKQRNTGQIRSIEEFTSKLETLTNEITTNVLQPTLSIYKGEQSEEINSETYNFMLDRVEDDLEAAFEEANNIDEVQRSHEALIRDVILKNLSAGVAELEAKINLFEFLNKDTRGFDTAIFSTFRESKEGRTQRDSDYAKLLFVDPRQLRESIPTTEDATVELIGERLILGVDTSDYYTIQDARQIFDSESPQSEQIVEPPDNSLRNMIDNTKGTFWTQTSVFQQKKNYVKTKLEFDLGVVKEVNFIEIEPASRHGLVLEAVHYLDGNNTVTDLSVPEQDVSSPVSLQIKKVATRRFILTFRNENGFRADFQYKDTDSLFAQAFQGKPLIRKRELRNLSEDLYNTIPSKKISSVLGVAKRPRSMFSGYQYSISIDNIRIGLNTHDDRSIYVSSSLDVGESSSIGLRTLESRPYVEASTGLVKFTNTTYDVDQDSSLVDDSSLVVGEQSNVWFQSSIEYWISGIDLNADGTLLRSKVFPILPLNTTRIYHERLSLDSKSNIALTENDLGSTMFFTTRTDGDVKVYRNGILISDSTGVVNPVSGWADISTQADKTPNNGDPMKFKVQVFDRLPGDIFTVSYTPVVSSTRAIPQTLSEFTQAGGLKVVDLIGNLSARVGSGHMINLDKTTEEGGTSLLYLRIILRQNAADPSLTAAVEEYTLLAGRKDDSKFEDL